jgi:hypothetical protein
MGRDFVQRGQAALDNPEQSLRHGLIQPLGGSFDLSEEHFWQFDSNRVGSHDPFSRAVAPARHDKFVYRQTVRKAAAICLNEGNMVFLPTKRKGSILRPRCPCSHNLSSDTCAIKEVHRLAYPDRFSPELGELSQVQRRHTRGLLAARMGQAAICQIPPSRYNRYVQC